MRLNLITTAFHPPGCCLFCRRTVSSIVPCLDTGVHDPDDDRIYICVDCVDEFNAILGRPREKEIDNLKDELEVIKNEAEALVDMNSDLARKLDLTTNEIFQSLMKDVQAKAGAKPQAKRPGRPPGSRNKPKAPARPNLPAEAKGSYTVSDSPVIYEAIKDQRKWVGEMES